MTLSRLMIVSVSDMFLDRVVLVEAVEPSRTDAASTDRFWKLSRKGKLTSYMKWCSYINNLW